MMRKSAEEFRSIARNALQGRWMPAVGTTLIASILGGSICIGGAGNIFGNAANTVSRETENITDWDPVARGVILGILGVLGAGALIYTLITYVIGSFVSLGLMRYNLNLVDGKDAQLSQLFGSASLWSKAIRLNIRVTIFTMLWSILFVIPGIVKSYAYSMSGFILEENPEMTPKEAVEVSQRMMRGNKWRLFCLQLSFIGWAILSVLFFGIGMLWLRPYMNAAITAFYDEISREPFE